MSAECAALAALPGRSRKHSLFRSRKREKYIIEGIALIITTPVGGYPRVDTVTDEARSKTDTSFVLSRIGRRKVDFLRFDIHVFALLLGGYKCVDSLFCFSNHVQIHLFIIGHEPYSFHIWN